MEGLSKRSPSFNCLQAVQSECTLNIDHYDKAADYWYEDLDAKSRYHSIYRCAACVEVGEGQWDCGDGPQLDDPGQRPQHYNPGEAYDSFITVDVTGPPEFSEWIVPRVDQDSTKHGARVTINYCADPPPSNSGVEWVVDNTQIRPGVGRQGNFEAHMIELVSVSFEALLNATTNCSTEQGVQLHRLLRSALVNHSCTRWRLATRLSSARDERQRRH